MDGSPKEGPQKEAIFLNDLAVAVDSAFSARRKLVSMQVEEPDGEDDHGVFASNDPRHDRIVVDENRVIVQNLDDYRALLPIAFGKIYKDQTKAFAIASTIIVQKRGRTINPETEEYRHAIDFLETPDGYPGIETPSFTIRRFVSESPNWRDLNLQEKRKIKFVTQLDPKYQYVVDEGIIPNLKNTGLCWLAGAEMAISPFVPDGQVRNNIMKSLIGRIKNSGYFDSRGGFDAKKIDFLTEELNETFMQHRIPVAAKFHDDIVFDDLADTLRDGSTMLFGMSDSGGGHMLVASEILHTNGEQVFFQTYDPSARDEIASKKVTDNFTIYRDHKRGTMQIIPFLVSFNKIKDATEKEI